MDNLSKRSMAPTQYKAFLKKQAQEQLKGFKPKQVDIPDVNPIITPDPELMDSFQRVGSGKMPRENQGSILGGSGGITQRFGNRNNIEVFSNGINTGTDFGTAVGTPIALPPGRWNVLSSFRDAAGKGYIGNKTNSGYGNSILVQNAETGEKLRFSHLSDVGVDQGDEIDGGYVIGRTGDSGNVTGPHLDLEYYDKLGRIADVMQSMFARYLGGQ